MNLYYKTLGIEEGADKKEIKKAYFKAIRQYPPDKEPEQFKKIREAYEYLMKDENRERLEKLAGIEPVFQKAYLQILDYEERKEYGLAIQCCLEVLHISDVEEIQYLLAGLYEKNHNSGKEVKEFESLIRKYPENLKYREGLGRAYVHREWRKKALEVFDQLYAKRYQSLSYYFAYGSTLMEQCHYTEGRKILLEAVRYFSALEQQETRLVEMNDIWYALMKAGIDFRQRNLVEDLKSYFRFFDQYQDAWELRHSAMAILGMLCELEDPEEPAIAAMEGLVTRMKGLAQDHVLEPTTVLNLKSMEYRVEYYRFFRDKRLHWDIRDNAEFIYGSTVYWLTQEEEMEDFCFASREESEAAVIDMKLTILGQWKTAKEQVQIIKDDYPICTNILGDFVEEILQNRKKPYLWSKYERQYKKAMHFPSSGHLTTREQERIVFDSSAGDTYRREAPKVGRNDPCPCGSGKKYKNCCGKN